VVAALPVMWITREAAFHPIITLGLSAASYAAVYFGLSYLLVRVKADSTDSLIAVESGLSQT
jgi:hypothetical protein